MRVFKADQIAELVMEYVVLSLALAPVKYGIPVRGYELRVQTEIDLARNTISLFERSA